jgi:hypothetical protein
MNPARYFFIILIGLSCNSVKAQDPNNDSPSEHEDQAAQVVKSPDGENYFPKGKESYYTKYYRAANLPSLLSKREPEGHLRFRLAILPSFTKPLFLTYSRGAEGATIEITRLGLRKVDGNLELGPMELTGKVAIGEHVAKQLEADAVDPNIRLPLRQYTEKQIQLLQLLDGCTWILEVSTDKAYTMADVTNPEWMGHPDPKIVEQQNLPKVDTTFFIEFCAKLLDITDLRVPENGAPENDG